jgi:hypothetical protein
VGANTTSSIEQPTACGETVAAPCITLERLKNLLTNVQGSTGHTYGVKDSRGVGMDCMRVIYAPIHGVRRYLALYHHYQTDIKTFHIFIAQSFDLLKWEFLRRVVSNADMPALQIDAATGRVLLVYEHFLSSKERWPCAVGVRLYSSIDTLISGKPLSMYTAPNTISRIEGTPNIYSFDDTKQTIEIGFHYQNESLIRDEVARGLLRGFPGKEPVWTATVDAKYNSALSKQGVTGNIGGRDVLQFNSNPRRVPIAAGTNPRRVPIAGTIELDALAPVFMISEGNVQPPPAHPTAWDSWRVWLWTTDAEAVTPLHVQTHQSSVAVANPSMTVLPAPLTGQPALFVTYFIFSEGAAKGEGGPLAFFTQL